MDLHPVSDGAPRVVFIAGSMRSGSTLVAELLGSYEGVVAIGEINNMASIGVSGQWCSCGSEALHCPVWGSIVDELSRDNRASELSRLRQTLERQRRLPQLLALRHVKEPRWPTDIARYVDVLRTTVERLARNAGARVVVDSSKSAAAMALMLLAHPDAAVVHVLRDPVAVAGSESRRLHVRDALTTAPPRPRSVPKSSVDWLLGNVECRLVGRTARRYAVVHHGSLCSGPSETLERIAEEIGLSGEGPHFLVDRTVQLATSHVLAGNPSRNGPRVRTIRAAEQPDQPLSAPERALVRTLTWPAVGLVRQSGPRSHMAWTKRATPSKEPPQGARPTV